LASVVDSGHASQQARVCVWGVLMFKHQLKFQVYYTNDCGRKVADENWGDRPNAS